MQFLEWPLRITDRLTAILLGLMLITITLVLFTNAVARYFAGIAITGGEELARCLMVWMTFLGSYLLVRTRGHVAIDIFARAFSGRAEKVLTTLIALLGLAVSVYVAYYGWQLTERIFNTGQRMSSLPFARGWFYLAVPIGFGLMSVAFLQLILATWTGITLPKQEDFAPEDAATAKPEENGVITAADEGRK